MLSHLFTASLSAELESDEVMNYPDENEQDADIYVSGRIIFIVSTSESERIVYFRCMYCVYLWCVGV